MTTTVLAVALAVALAAPAVASARTKGFEINNLSGSSIRLTSVDTFGKQPFEEVNGVALKPRPGYMLEPGWRPMHVELKADLLGDTYRADLQFVNSRGVTFSANLSTGRRSRVQARSRVATTRAAAPAATAPRDA